MQTPRDKPASASPRGMLERRAAVASRRVRLPNDERRTLLLELGIRPLSSHSYVHLSLDHAPVPRAKPMGLPHHHFIGKRACYR